jgi:ABC-2 type transport system permease protein/bacitracin transport system permease protein
LGYYSYFITLIISFITGLTVPVSTVLLRGFEQMTVISLSTYISVLPIIVFTSRKRDAFLGGVVVSFLFGYFSMFVKNATLRSMYPILSGLTIIRFDTKLYMNTSGSGSFAISLFTMAVVLLLTGRLILTSYSGNAHL